MYSIMQMIESGIKSVQHISSSLRPRILDDHPIMRSGLRSALSSVSDIHVADEAVNGQEALKKKVAARFDIVLLDISLPGMSGFDVLKQMRLNNPQQKIIMLTTLPEKQYAMRCLKAGAMGYLTKESAPSALITAIRHVAAGERYVSQGIAEIAAKLNVSIPTVHTHRQRLLDKMGMESPPQLMLYVLENLSNDKP